MKCVGLTLGAVVIAAVVAAQFDFFWAGVWLLFVFTI